MAETGSLSQSGDPFNIPVFTILDLPDKDAFAADTQNYSP
jgi:hypothetical protein